jgi:Ca2+-binding EF-hand superfamily protein
MTKKTIAVFLLVMSLLLTTGLAAAAGQDKPILAETAYTKMDADGNGEITLAEFRAYWKGRFSDIDADKDGKLMAAEFERDAIKTFGVIDKDKNNVLVAQEFVAYWCGPDTVDLIKGKAVPTKKIDADGDGKIGKDECVVFWRARFNEMDEDRNGKVTMVEFLKNMDKEFKEMDKNGDGYISVQEYDIYWAEKASAKKGK